MVLKISVEIRKTQTATFNGWPQLLSFQNPQILRVISSGHDVIHTQARLGFIMTGEYQLIGLVGRVFANGPGGWGSIPGRVIPKTLKMVLDTSFLNTQHYNVRIKGKVEQSREKSSALQYVPV